MKTLGLVAVAITATAPVIAGDVQPSTTSTMIGSRLPGSSSNASDCSIFVSTEGNDEYPGTKDAPVRTPEAAIARRRQKAPSTVSCIIRFAAGTYHIKAPPLELGPADSNTTWVGSGRETVFSAGIPVDDSCWKRDESSIESRSAVSGVWSCTLHSHTSPFRVLTVRGERKRQARFPDFDPKMPYTGGWLYINSSRFIGNNSFVIGVSERSLPGFARSKSWKGAKVQIFPTKSWVRNHAPQLRL